MQDRKYKSIYQKIWEEADQFNLSYLESEEQELLDDFFEELDEALEEEVSFKAQGANKFLRDHPEIKEQFEAYKEGNKSAYLDYKQRTNMGSR